MKYTVVSSTEWAYPDRMDYPSASSQAAINAIRKSYATVQILLTPVKDGASVKVHTTGDLKKLALETFELVPVYVESNPFLDGDRATPHCPCRRAPYYLYECIKPMKDTLSPKDGVAGLYLSFPIPEQAKPGLYAGDIVIDVGGETVSVPAKINVFSAVLPKITLKTINGYSSYATAKYNHVAIGSPEHQELDAQNYKYLRRMHQNMLYVGGVKAEMGEDGKYVFDFSQMEEHVEHMLSLGFEYFNAPSIGGRKSWKEPTILVGPRHELPSMSYEGYVWLSQYVPALRDFLAKKGWLDRFYMGISDEPNDANATEFRALCGLVRKFAPEIRLIDALSYCPVHGALDVWVPLNASYDKHMKEFESFRGKGDEIWHYVCCGPRGEGYINRFMDYELLSTRYLYWGNYKYDMGGYLHWATNSYQPGQDPYTTNCPLHTNTDSGTTLPSGDTHLLYPGYGESFMSMRLEAQRDSVEDYELLKVLSKADKKKADEICEKVFRSFKDVEYDVAKFEAARVELYEAVSAL